MAIDWNRGYTSKFTVNEVDRRSWGSASEIGRVISADIDLVDGGLCESGSLSMTGDGVGQFDERYLRITMEAEQDGLRQRVEIATLLCSSSEGEFDHGVDTVEVEGRSVLYPASTRKVHDLGNDPYAPMGVDGAEFAASLLGKCVQAPISVEGSFILGSSVVFDLDDSYLDAARAVLDVGGFIIQVDGHGTIHVRALPSEPDKDMWPVTAESMMPSIGHSLDMSEIPNRYRAEIGSVSAVAVNDDPASRTSVPYRGYYVDADIDSDAKPLEGESLAEYARRKLVELSVAEDVRKLSREYRPGLLPCDVADYIAPDGGIHGRYRVKRQSLTLGRGIKVSEEVAEEVVTWQG